MNETTTAETEASAFAHWARETTRRLCRTVLRCGPGFTTYDIASQLGTSRQPAQDPEYETGRHPDLLSVVLAHLFHQALLAEYPEIAIRLWNLSYAEALHVAYHHTRDV